MSYDISIRPEDLSFVSSGNTNIPPKFGTEIFKENFIMTQVDNVSEANSGNRNSRQFLLLLIFFQTVFIILFGFLKSNFRANLTGAARIFLQNRIQRVSKYVFSRLPM